MSPIAWVDLSASTVRLQPVDTGLTARFLGGRGLGAALLFRHLADPGDPLAPDNPLIFSVGPLTGTPWPTGARTHVTFHSPLTGIYGYANTGGLFGAALRRAGYAVLVIIGHAERPAYLEVTPDGVAIRPADHLWGQGTHATHDTLASGGARVACIGPAGEHGVRFAAIINDGGRAAARCGGGAVMGSKNLKAVVVRGQRPLDLPAEFRALARRAFEQVRDHPNVIGLRDWGTVSLVAIKNHSGDLPARNHQLGQVPWADRIDAQTIARYTRKTKGCFACPIRCGRVTRVESGPHAGDLEGPEYESLNALGPMCWIGDPEVIIHANRLCNDLGLDTISTGVTIAFAMECHQRGLLDDPELSLEWGDADTVLGLIERIAHRRGLGDRLAEGVRHAAESIGPEAARYAMHVKGMELPRQEPRIAKGFGLGHATSNRGADHLYALPTIDLAGNLDTANRFFPPEIVPALMDTDDETHKPDLVVFSEHYCAVSDALGVCKFTTAETYALYPEDLAAGLSTLWGREVSGEELLAAGERIVNLERLYNARLKLSRADDRLPDRFTSEPLEVYTFDRDEETGKMRPSPEPVHVGRLRDFDATLDRYYRLRGWDENGIPTPETLRRLGLDEWTSSKVTIARSERVIYLTKEATDMRTDGFRGRDLISLLDWNKEEVETILDVALELKRARTVGELHDHILRAKTLFMIFYNQSLRTRNSFEAGMTQLGGHAHFLDPSKIYTPALPGKEVAYSTERVSDVARVLARMGEAIAIRCYGDPVDWVYGGASEIIRNFAYWADIPVLNMECDKYHPFQALADVLTVKEKFGAFKGVKFVMSWAYSPSVHKPRAVPQSAIIAASMMGCDTVLARPPEMALDPEIIQACEKYAEMNDATFEVTDDFMGAAKGAHVLYPKAWAATSIFQPPVGENDMRKTQEIFDSYKDWKATREYMELADHNAIYMHCLPADRNWEVEDEVIDNTDPQSGWRSVAYDEAENRLHVQKAVMSLVM